MSDNNQNNQTSNRKGLSRRDFLKIGTTAVVGGALASKASKVFAAPNFLRAGPLSLKLLTWFWEEPNRKDAWRNAIKDFHASQADIRIEEGGWAFDQYTDNILIQVKAGKIDGDMYTNTPDLAVRMMAAGQMAPIEDVLDKAGVKDLNKAHDFLRKDGHLYGLDIVTVMFGLLYNSAMFDKASVKAPTSIDEWVSISKTLTKRPDQFGIYSPHVASLPESTWFTLQEWVMPYDGLWAKGKTPLVSSDPVINGVKLFKTMYDNAFPQGTDDATATKMYGAGQIAQELIVSAAVGVFKDANPDLYPLLRSAVPPWPSKKTLTRIHPIAVNANAPQANQDASKEFLAFLYKKENYQKLMETALDVLPAYPGVLRPEYVNSLKWLDGYNAGVPVTPPELLGDFILYNSEFGKIVTDHLQEVLSANRPVEDAMGDAQKELEALGERVFSS